MLGLIKILNGPLKGQAFQLNIGENRIGRNSSNDISIAEGTLSRHHFSMVVQQDGIQIVKTSKNGLLRLDGVDIESQDLSGTHRIQAGKIHFMFKMGSGADFSKVIDRAQTIQSEDGSLEDDATEQTLSLNEHDFDDQLQDQGPQQEEWSDDNDKEVAPQAVQKPRTVKEAQALAKAQAQALSKKQAEEQGAQSPPDGPELLQKNKNNSLSLILKVLVLGILLVVAYKVTQTIEHDDLTTITLPYRAGEEKLIDLFGHLRREGIRQAPSTIELDAPLVLRAQLDPPPLPILWFKALKQGTCTVTLRDRQKRGLIKLKFVIQGALEKKSQVFERQNLSQDEKVAQAEQWISKGLVLAKETPHLALHHYKEALKLLELVSTTHPLYFKCRQAMAEPQAALDLQLQELWAEANRYRKNKAYAQSLTFIERILDLLKDPQNIDHQRAKIHKKYILRKISP